MKIIFLELNQALNNIDENKYNEALKKLLIENEWIIDAEFNVAEFICYEIV